MPRTYLVFGDIEGKLDVLRVECSKCGRAGHYGVARLIEKHGREARCSTATVASGTPNTRPL
jgi:hypothetical protein